MARVVAASIRELCRADHHGDPEILARWLADKTPEGFAARIAGSARLFVAETGGSLVGVGEVETTALAEGVGRITLMYVAPEARGKGVSSALLARMEAWLAAAGARHATLTATATARAFYLSRGWQVAGPPRKGRWILGHPLARALATRRDGTRP